MKDICNAQVPARMFYYLLDWSDKNDFVYLKSLGKIKISELDIVEFMKMFKHASNDDLSNLLNGNNMKAFFESLQWTRKFYSNEMLEDTSKIFRNVNAARNLLTFAEASNKYVRSVYYGKDSLGEFIAVVEKRIGTKKD